MDEDKRARVAALFSAMGHSNRITIVELLSEEELSVGEISSRLGLGQSSASQHLAALLRSGVLTVTQRGTCRLYRVRGPRIPKILALITEFCEVQGLSGTPSSEADDV